MDEKRNLAVTIAIIVLYVCQFLNCWTYQDLTNHYLECHRENMEFRRSVLDLRKEVLELYKDIQEPLEEIQSILKKIEPQ